LSWALLNVDLENKVLDMEVARFWSL